MSTTTPLANAQDPSLAQRCKAASLENFFQIASKNANTTFFRESSHLDALRSAGSASPTAFDDANSFHDTFKTNVGFSDYSAYDQFISRFRLLEDGTSDESAVRDLLSPGLPIFVARTSGTSSSTFKFFPKYPNPAYSSAFPPGPGPFTKCSLLSSRAFSYTHIRREDGTMLTIPNTTITSGVNRIANNITKEDEEEVARRYGDSCVAPLAVSFIPGYHEALTINFLFALFHSTLQKISGTFTIFLYDGFAGMERDWSVLVDCVEKGVPPPGVDLGPFGHIIKDEIKPNPTRAQELRQIKPGQPGWIKQIWPQLSMVSCSASGVYALALSKLRHHMGPEVQMITVGLNCTECCIAWAAPIDLTDIHLYKLNNFDFVEFLDVKEDEDSANLHAPWEVEIGKKYELVITTHDGLWRYRQQDVVHIVGFDPASGFPLLRFVERRGSKFRVGSEFVGEEELVSAILAAGSVLGSVLEFTTTIDYRTNPRGYGFFVELSGGDPATDFEMVQKDGRDEPRRSSYSAPCSSQLTQAAMLIDSILCQNAGYDHNRKGNLIALPAIRVVSPGTFGDYRSWKVEKDSVPVGQTKIPVCTIDPEAIRRLEERVIADSTGAGGASSASSTVASGSPAGTGTPTTAVAGLASELAGLPGFEDEVKLQKLDDALNARFSRPFKKAGSTLKRLSRRVKAVFDELRDVHR